MLNSIPNNKREQLQPLIEHLLNKTHKCYQSCTASNNIIYYTYTFIEGEPVITVVVQCSACNQLTYLLYTLDNFNTPIYNQPIIIPKYIQQFFKTFSPKIHYMHYVCISQNYFAHTLVNYYTYLMVQTSRRNKNILHKNTYLYPNCSRILQYCKVNSPVYYTPALQLIEESLESNWRSRTILRTILITPLDTLYKQWYNLHVNKVLR